MFQPISDVPMADPYQLAIERVRACVPARELVGEFLAGAPLGSCELGEGGGRAAMQFAVTGALRAGEVRFEASCLPGQPWQFHKLELQAAGAGEAVLDLLAPTDSPSRSS